MPHIVVEYSDNLQEVLTHSQLVKNLHKVVVDSGLFSPDAVKARALAYTDYVLPEGATRFVHVTTSILDGRSEQQRLALSEAMFAMAKESLPEDVKLSVNIHEMNKATYKK